MFLSKKRDVVIPQSEHLKLASTIASLWGNSEFDRPIISMDSFVTGVAFHDRGYGLLDRLQLGATSEEDWIATQVRGFGLEFEDKVADIVSKKHIVRLLKQHETEGSLVKAEEFEKELLKTIGETQFTEEDFEYADRITELSDSISFDFCFEKPVESYSDVFLKVGDEEQTRIDYEINNKQEIKLNPWPLSVDRYEGFIFGYKKDGYPEKLNPVLIPFVLIRK